jgi:hypothetical protein
MPEFFLQPGASELSSELEILSRHQLTYEFRAEVQYRDEFQRYCQWYYQTAAQHRQELEQMRGDINLLGLFCRRRSS